MLMSSHDHTKITKQPSVTPEDQLKRSPITITNDIKKKPQRKTSRRDGDMMWQLTILAVEIPPEEHVGSQFHTQVLNLGHQCQEEKSP